MIDSRADMNRQFCQLGQAHTTASYYHRHSKGTINRTRRAIVIPSKIDWRGKGVIGPVESQESCGACWAFSTVGVVESMYAIENGTLYPLSVQEVGCCIPDTLLFYERRGGLLEERNAKFSRRFWRKRALFASLIFVSVDLA